MNFNFLLEKKNKANICEPKYKDWINAANKNMIASHGRNFSVCGIPASAFKQSVREEVLKAAYSFCKKKNIAVKAKDFDTYIFATGHQATFYHPGIWLKNFLINECARNDNITGLNIWVDYEEGCRESFAAPGESGKTLVRKNICLNVPPCNNITARLLPPTANLWENFSEQVARFLKTLPGGTVLSNFEKYLKSAKYAAGAAKNLSEFIALSRRHYEEAGAAKNYLELPASSILDKKSFLYFFLDILNKIDAFNIIYNDCLEDYRAKHFIANSANPFPNLRAAKNLFELPFWAILPNGLRAGLWYDKSTNTLCAKREKFLTLSKKTEENLSLIKASEYKIVFKAVTLMMFFRVFVSDFFLHGVGGAKYDVITDEIIRKFYHITPPSYAMATMNLYADLPKIKYNDKEKFEIEKKLIQLKHNPQNFISEKELGTHPEAKKLIKEKAQLIIKIKDTPLDDKKIMADKIKRINAELEALIKPVRQDLEKTFALLTEKEQEYSIAAFREYPFCFYDPKDMEEMADKIKG